MMETDHETGRDKNAGKVHRTRKRPRDGQGEVMSAVLNIWVLGGGFAVALSLGLYYLSSQKHVAAAYWFAGSGMLLVLASLIQVLPYAHRWDSDEDGLSESEKVALRPYVGVSHVEATMEIGKPISILIKFTNSGKTPAEDVEILQVFEKVTAGTAPDRTYAGRNFERRSIGPINVGNTVETKIIGHEWTLDELMTISTDRTFQIFAHESFVTDPNT